MADYKTKDDVIGKFLNRQSDRGDGMTSKEGELYLEETKIARWVGDDLLICPWADKARGHRIITRVNNLLEQSGSSYLVDKAKWRNEVWILKDSRPHLEVQYKKWYVIVGVNHGTEWKGE